MADTGWGQMGWGGTLESGGGGGGGEGDGPTVENFSPAAGVGINRGTDLTFDLMFNGGEMASVTVFIDYFESGASEVVYDKTGFKQNFHTFGGFVGSEAQLLPDDEGIHFIVRRRAGWPHSPKVRVEGADTGGNPIEE